jgi:2-polyprenyl-6-methoxyphenol hydroxylase-like FAD-dependent oxidoreductase
MASIDKILIVGAGIGGLTSAAALAQHGFSPELVERDPAWVAVGAGIAIQPNAMRILRWLGMDGSIRAVGAALRRWTFTDEQGEFLCQHDLDGLWGDLGPGVCITRRKLQQVLIAGAGPAPVRLGTSVSALVERDDCVSVAFTDGSVGEYDLVIGADGIHSVVRDLVMGGIMPTFANQIAWRSLVRMRLPGLPGVHFSLGDSCFFGLCSVGDDVTYGFGNVSADRFHEPLEGRLRRLRDRFAYFGPTVADYLARLDRDDQIHCSLSNGSSTRTGARRASCSSATPPTRRPR